VRELQLDVSTVIEMAWVDNGPGWLGVLLDTAASVLSATADDVTMPIGLVGPHPLGAPTQFEVRALFPSDGKVLEDPATGSLNASLAIWLLSSGRAQAPYVASQGAAIGRAGLISVEQDADGVIWIHGSTTTIVQGSIEITAAG
jgi:predicted PhzF superfamily epimerase YddE/YHI9